MRLTEYLVHFFWWANKLTSGQTNNVSQANVSGALFLEANFALLCPDVSRFVGWQSISLTFGRQLFRRYNSTPEGLLNLVDYLLLNGRPDFKLI